MGMFYGLEVLNNKSACLILSINIKEHGSILCKYIYIKKNICGVEDRNGCLRLECVGGEESVNRFREYPAPKIERKSLTLMQLLMFY